MKERSVIPDQVNTIKGNLEVAYICDVWLTCALIYSYKIRREQRTCSTGRVQPCPNCRLILGGVYRAQKSNEMAVNIVNHFSALTNAYQTQRQ